MIFEIIKISHLAIDGTESL